jgi:hypothetical protein
MRPIALLLLLVAAACDVPVATPLETEAPAPPPDRPAEKPDTDPSIELTAYYARVEEGLVSRGLLRTDGGGADTPFSADDLVRNFERIALYEEYATVDGRIVAAETESRIHKWTDPVLIEPYFSAGIDPARAARDRSAVEDYAARLARVTGHPIRVVDDGGNFHVLVLTEGERRDFGPKLREMIPGIGAAAVETVTEMSRNNYCLVFALDRAGQGVYSQALAVVRAEHPDLLRLSCFHEEIAQGLGLANDSPQARPSLFNDDEEFGLLTGHDEYLLRILYDARMRPGMVAGEALPLARTIAYELLPGT